ncbi:hypothetical protein [Pseudomonas mediterranea]
MKRKHPPRLVSSPVPTDTAAPTPQHPPTWDYPSEISTTGYLGTLLYAMALLLALPVYGLGVISVELFSTDGLSSAHTRVIEDPLFLTLMFVSAFAAVCMLCWLFSGPQVLGFCFDERQQRLTFIQRRPARAPTEECVPYSDIYSITPCVENAIAHACHLVVCFAGDNGKPSEIRFWMHIPLKDMAFHSAWLRQSIGEKMHEVLDLDM